MLTFIHISDTHIHSDPNYSREGAPHNSQAGARALVEAINKLAFPVDFVLHTGDVAYDPFEEAYDACHAILGEIEYPVYYVAGNHDASAALQTQLMGQTKPHQHLHYNIDVNGFQLVVVDSNGPQSPPAGYIIDPQINWLHQLCSDPNDNRPLIIATHHNPVNTPVPWLNDYMGIQNGEAFHEAIKPAAHRLRGVFFGHVHQNIDIYRDGVLYASTLSSWMQFQAYPGLRRTMHDYHAEPGYSIVHMTADQTFIRRCRYDLSK
jgi:3',5'-cyclic-AMP phosphodiesterase